MDYGAEYGAGNDPGESLEFHGYRPELDWPVRIDPHPLIAFGPIPQGFLVPPVLTDEIFESWKRMYEEFFGDKDPVQLSNFMGQVADDIKNCDHLMDPSPLIMSVGRWRRFCWWLEDKQGKLAVWMYEKISGCTFPDSDDW
jgi:hypothetical protein